MWTANEEGGPGIFDTQKTFEVERDIGKQHRRYLASLCKWITEQSLGDITKRFNLLRGREDSNF